VERCLCTRPTWSLRCRLACWWRSSSPTTDGVTGRWGRDEAGRNMSRAHRLEQLERSLGAGQASSAASICFQCAGPARAYRMEFDLAWIFAVAEGRARPWEGSPEEAAAELREIADSAEPDHCPYCDTLTTVGYVRERLK
jgi:hypothetical protein